MRKILLIIAFIGATSLVNAQTNLSNAVDFTVTDLEGHEHNLFDYLNDGKYVCIDFFAYWCGPCMDLADDFTDVYHMYGCNEGDVIFLAIELEGTEEQTHDFEQSHAGENPAPAVSGTTGGGGPVHDIYGIQAFPTYVLIAPDQTIVEQDIWPMSAQILDDVLAEYDLEHMECSVVSIEETQELSLSAYPNPVASDLSIDLEGINGVAEIMVYNLIGEVVYNEQTTLSRAIVDVRTWANGSYLVQIADDTNVVTQKISVIK